MASPFAGFEVEEELRPVARLFPFDLDRGLSSIVALESRISPEAMTASSLGTERIGNAVVIGADGLMLTIGYLVTEADEVIVTTNAGARVHAHPLGVDQATGFGLIQALGPLDLPPLPLGDSRTIGAEGAVIAAGGGGRAHALTGRIAARAPFAGYWEYYLNEALYVEPAHPHWSGAALIGPDGDLLGVGSLRIEHLTKKRKVQPLNLFVPAELLPPILDDLAHGRPTSPPRPWLGVFTQEISSHVVVVGVATGGPAARAELRQGDVIHRIAGERIRDQGGFYTRLWALGSPGVIVPLTIQREGDVFDVEIRSADRTAMQRRRRLN